MTRRRFDADSTEEFTMSNALWLRKLRIFSPTGRSFPGTDFTLHQFLNFASCYLHEFITIRSLRPVNLTPTHLTVQYRLFQRRLP